LAKANPGHLNYGSPGVGTTPQLAMELLKHMGGFDATHVPYRSLASALTDVIGGQIDMCFDNLPTSLPHIQQGELRALAIGAKTRVASLPDVPAIAESFPGFLSVTWFAIVAPPRTPSAIAAKVASAVGEVVRQPDVVRRLQDLGADPVGGSPEQTAVFLDEERTRWHQVIDSAGIRAE
jgi:tripartite-type tricarboxylate transporter receptor subunit TctC